MESSSSPISLLYWNYLNLLLLRPILAISFVLSFIILGWFLAWKLVLVHVPLLQEIFGLRKKPVQPKPPLRRRFSRFYNGISATNSASDWVLIASSVIVLMLDPFKIVSGEECMVVVSGWWLHSTH